MLKRLVKLAVSACVYASDQFAFALGRLGGKVSEPRAVVLYYHGVSPSERTGFERQMRVLRQRACPITCAPDKLQAGKLHAAVSFDDGFVSVAENALPALRENQVPATIFVASGYLGASPGWVKDPHIKKRNEILLTEPQLKALAQEPLVLIGSHSVSHPRLARLDAESALVELQSSKKSLETLIQKPVDLFSFPHGSFTEETLQLAERVGYTRVFGIQPTLAFRAPSEFLTGRIAVDPKDWMIEYILKLNGAYRWTARKA